MNKCVNIKSKEFIDLVRQSGLNPAVLSAKMGVWMEKNNTDEWPSLQQLGLSPVSNPITVDEVIKKYPELNELTTEEQTLISDLQIKDKLSQIKDSMIKSLESRYERSKRFKNISVEDLKEQEAFIKKISELETKKAIVLFTKQAIQSTNRVYSLWIDTYKPKVDAIKSGESKESLKDVLKPGLLYIWKDYLSVYDSIDDFINYLTNQNIEVGQTLINDLNQVRNRKNSIKSLYKDYGMDILAEELTPYYNQIYVDFEAQMKKKYQSLPESEKSKYTEDQYVNAQKDLQDVNLREQTINLLKEQLVTANNDIGFMTRWFVSGLETSDPIFAAIAKKLQFAELDRLTTKILPTRNKMVDMLREVEKISNSSNFKQLYDIMLEKDDKGNYTGKHVDRFGSWFWNEYERIKVEINNNSKLDEDDKVKAIKTWLKQNAPLDSKGFNKSKWEYINSLHKEGIITDKEVNELEDNEITYDFLSYRELRDQNRLSEKTSRLLGDWQHDNIWKYREPVDKWKSKNKSYRDFSRLPQSDSRVKFFNLLMDIKNEANKYLPVAKQLKNGDLPNILKSNDERIQNKDFSGAFKNVFARQFDVLVDDDTRGNEPLEDAEGNKIHLVPIYYTGKTNKKDENGNWIYDPKEQSYDLAGIFYRYYDMATRFNVRDELRSEVEMARYFIQNRDITLLDSKGNPVKKTTGVVTGGTNQKQQKGQNKLAEQLSDWIDENIYGIKEIGLGQLNILGLKVDKSKALKWLNKYTGLNIMALNLKTSVSNVIMGESQQIGEAFAQQHMNIKSFRKGSAFYESHLLGTVADVGNRKPTHIIHLLDEEFQISMESLDPKFKDSTLVKQLAKTSSLYFMLRFGDHWMKNRFFLGMLAEKRAYNSKGEDIGSMLDQYYVDKGELKIKPEVDLNKSKWNKEDRYNFTLKVQSILSGIHQEISPMGRAAAERNAILGLALLFRKFIAPGVMRRYKKRSYVERVGDYTEGYYRTTGRYFMQLYKEMDLLGLVLKGENWESLSPMEKANIVRTINDLAFLTVAILMTMLFTKLGDDDDDEWTYNFIAYQMMRFQTEILFFTPKIDETMTLLRSPFASMSILENVIKTMSQITNPTERYERGPWKGHLKFEKIMWDYIPVMRSFYQTRDIKTQMSFFSR